MSHKLSHEAASAEMKAAGLTPIEDYPGNKAKWLCKCDACGDLVTPSLASVRTNGGGCRACGLAKSAQTRRMPHEEATKLLLEYGATPLVDYPGSNSPWKSRCNTCNRDISPRLGNLKNGHAVCVYCAGKKLSPEDAIKFMIEKGYKPLVAYPGSNSPWKCECLKCGSTINPRLAGIKSGQGGCKKCGFEANSRKQRQDSKSAIDFVQEKGFEPLEDFPGTNKPWKLRCIKCKQIVHPQLSSIKNGSGCAVCGKRQTIPEQAIDIMRAANLEPLETFPGGRVHWKCRCLLCGNIVSPKYTDIQSGYGGCKYCGGHFVEPEAAVELMLQHGLAPQSPYVNAMSKWHCVCQSCNRSVYPTFNSVRTRGSGCAFCAKRKVDPDEAHEFMRSKGVTPLTPYPGARIGWHSTCNKCHLEVYPFYSSVRNQNANPCLYCAGKKVDGETAFQIMVQSGLTPLETYKRADHPWKCIHNKCERLVTPTYTSIRIGNGGCKYCAEKGIDFTAPAFIYLMKHEEFAALKVGIGNHKTRNNRITEHQRNGWTTIQTDEFESGEVAYEIEQAVLKWIRIDKGLKPCLTSRQMPQGGWTETFDSVSLKHDEVWMKLQEIKSMFIETIS